jgi:dienelactone hydrolase
MDVPFERVAIPYGNTTLPGYFLKPSTSNTRRPTVIINNGSDAQNLDTYAWGGAAALERGYNALLFEGPGQGSMLFERRIPFRPDWENVITPIVDWLEQRPDVDTSKIALTGWSFGGELVTQAAVHEHRLAAVCSDPGMLAAWQAWPEGVRALFTPTATEQEVNAEWTQGAVPAIEQDPTTKFTVAKRSEIFGTQFLDAARAGQVFTDLWTFGKTLMQYDCSGILSRITVPYLVMQYELDVIPAAQTQQVYDGIASKDKKMVTMTVAEGGEYHCCPMAPQRRNQIVFDWLDSTLHL